MTFKTSHAERAAMLRGSSEDDISGMWATLLMEGTKEAQDAFEAAASDGGLRVDDRSDVEAQAMTDRPETQTIEITDVLGIRRAEIPLTPGTVTHVVGLNGAGKSSIAVCAQALLARAVDPLGLGRARAGYAGGGTAPYARLGGTVWRPTQGSVEIEEGQRASSPAAVGLVDFTARLDATRRREAIAAALGIDTRAIAAIADHVHGSDAADAEHRVGAEGWAAAEAVYRDRARRAKREWRETAGEQYGVAKAADWAPAGWHADLDSLDPAGARAAIADAQEAHEEAVRNTGASDASRAARAKAIADLPRTPRAARRARGGGPEAQRGAWCDPDRRGATTP